MMNMEREEKVLNAQQVYEDAKNNRSKLIDIGTDKRRTKRIQKKQNKIEIKIAQKLNIYESNGSFLDDFLKEVEGVQVIDKEDKASCEEDSEGDINMQQNDKKDKGSCKEDSESTNSEDYKDIDNINTINSEESLGNPAIEHPIEKKLKVQVDDVNSPLENLEKEG